MEIIIYILILIILLLMIFHLIQFMIFKRKFVPILMYHRVTSIVKDDQIRFINHKGQKLDLDSMKVYPHMFDQQMGYLKKRGYISKNFGDESFRPSKKEVYITFDDGYQDNYLNAYPILKTYNLTATIYLTFDLLKNKTYMPIDHNDQKEENALLKLEEIKEMYAFGIRFGSHTLTHPWLTDPSANLEKEIIHSKLEISKICSFPIYSFAYPGGLYNQEVLTMVKEHYNHAVVTSRGSDLSLFSHDVYQIERETISRYDSMLMFKLKLWGIHRYIRKIKWLTYLRKMIS